EVVVDGDRGLGRHPVGDAADGAPRALGEVATERDDAAVADTVTHERRATQQTARAGDGLRHVVGGQVHVHRVADGVDRAPQQRLDPVIEGEAGQLPAVLDQVLHAVDDVSVQTARGGGRGAEGDTLAGVVQVVVERATGRGAVATGVVRHGEVEGASERASQRGAQLAGEVARVGPDDLGGHHRDRGELLRHHRHQAEAHARRRLLPSLILPVRGGAAGDDRDRSEERRVGKGCSARWSPSDYKNNVRIIYWLTQKLITLIMSRY